MSDSTLQKILNKLHFFGDVKAAEQLSNNSICVLDNNEIRNRKDSDNEDETVYVYVKNWSKASEIVYHIEENEYVRYTII